MMSNRAVVFIWLVAAIAAFACDAQEKIRVVATFYVPYEFTRNVGSERVVVGNLLPAGAEPHDYEPMPADIRAVEAAQAFVYNGADMDTQLAQRILGAVRNRNQLVLIEATRGLSVRKTSGEGFQVDPHVWLDPVLAQTMVKNIENGLIQADEPGRATYEANGNVYRAKIDALDTVIRKGLESCRLRDLIISHQFLDYFSARYHLTVHSLSGFEPGEPAPQRLKELIELGRRLGIKYVFAEPLTQSKALEVLARELGAQILTLNPIEGLTEKDEQAGKSYLSIMKDNLKNLRIGLRCQ